MPGASQVRSWRTYRRLLKDSVQMIRFRGTSTIPFRLMQTLQYLNGTQL